MRFSARTTWQIAVFSFSFGLVSACTSTEQSSDVDADSVTAEDSDEGEAALPPVAPLAPAPVMPEELSEPAGKVDAVPSPAAAPKFNASTTRRVMYVKTDGTVIREKAEANSRVIGKLNRGDHLLVNIEGEWARTDQGGYIALKGLSEKGIGRSKSSGQWKGGNNGSVSAPKSKAPQKTTAPAEQKPTPTPPPPSADSPAGAGVAPDAAPSSEAEADSIEE